jgi:hypothetical protein
MCIVLEVAKVAKTDIRANNFHCKEVLGDKKGS